MFRLYQHVERHVSTCKQVKAFQNRALHYPVSIGLAFDDVADADKFWPLDQFVQRQASTRRILQVNPCNYAAYEGPPICLAEIPSIGLRILPVSLHQYRAVYTHRSYLSP